jgi:glycosyltransferase involved in cell wall biosynthesis
MAESLIRNNSIVTIIYRTRGPKVATLINPEFEGFSIKGGSWGSFREYKMPLFVYIMIKLLFCFSATLKIIDINKKQRISLIHAQDINFGALASVVPSLILRVPLIIHGHNIDPKHPNLVVRSVERLVNKLVLDYSSKVICVGNAVKQYAVSMGADPRKITVLTPGIDLDKFKAKEYSRSIARHTLGIDEKSFVIGYIGRLAPEKNVGVLVEAIADLIRSKRLEIAFLIIIGNGEDETKLRKLAEELGIRDRVLFTGFRSDVSDLIHGLDVFVLPSLTEGLGLSLLEAKAAGKAIIASNIPSIRENIHNRKTGLLVNPRKKEEIENAVLELYQKPELRELVSANATKEAMLYDKKRFAQELLKIYKMVCSRRSCFDYC